ncbi:hypothetical protein J7E62_16135 [Variovorax paradoxus]|nr:hypothetical protein [Variovorax paradoxus]
MEERELGLRSRAATLNARAVEAMADKSHPRPVALSLAPAPRKMHARGMKRCFELILKFKAASAIRSTLSQALPVRADG